MSGNEKYRTTTTELGFISNYDLLGNPQPYVTPITNILQGAPMASPLGAIVVGAPYHFYFGLNNGKTAIDRFYKLYVSTEE